MLVQFGQLLCLGWRVRPLEQIQEPEPVFSHRLGISGALLLALGKPLIFNPPAVALIPFHRRHTTQPIRRHRSQLIQGGSHRLTYQLQPVQYSDSCQDPGSVGPLGAPGFNQS